MASLYELAKKELIAERTKMQQKRSDRFRVLVTDILGKNPTDLYPETANYAIPINLDTWVYLRLCEHQPYSLEFSASLTGKEETDFVSEPFEGRLDFAVQVDLFVIARRAIHRSAAVGGTIPTASLPAQTDTYTDLIQVQIGEVPEFVNLATVTRSRFETVDGERRATLYHPAGEIQLTGEDAFRVEDRYRGRRSGSERLRDSR